MSASLCARLKRLSVEMPVVAFLSVALSAIVVGSDRRATA